MTRIPCILLVLSLILLSPCTDSSARDLEYQTELYDNLLKIADSAEFLYLGASSIGDTAVIMVKTLAWELLPVSHHEVQEEALFDLWSGFYKKTDFYGIIIVDENLNVLRKRFNKSTPIKSNSKRDAALLSNLHLRLEAGESYILAETTPLMPELRPADPIAAMDKIKKLPPGTKINIIQVIAKETGKPWEYGDPGSPWYQVEVPNLSLSGWINNIALIGDPIEKVK